MTDQQQAQTVLPEHPCRMPNAERLAREGVGFRNAFCPTAHCCPSRATFFTGLYPSRHGVYNNVSTPTAIRAGLNPGVTTFGEGLRDAGYHLAFSGKWHVSNTENPSDRGWRELEVTARAGSYMHTAPEKWREMALREKERGDPERERGQIKRPGWGDSQLYRTLPDAGGEKLKDHQVVQSAVDVLPELAAGKEPWALYVGLLAPHDPFNAPERFVAMYDRQKIPLPPSYRDTLDDKPRVYQRMRRQYWDQLTEDEVRESIAHYWACCTLTDTLLGETLHALEKTGQADDTLVLFLSDHGEYAGAHGLYLKGVPAFREAYEIPCIARWPKGITRPGRTVESLVTLADFAPTFLEIAGIPPPPDLTGRSLVPFFADQTPPDWPDAVFTQFNGVELYYTQRAVRTRDWKYVYNGFDDDELYDLRRDPHERVNLARKPEHDMEKRTLLRRMWRFAAKEKDELIFNAYGTVALAPYGPADAWADSE